MSEFSINSISLPNRDYSKLRFDIEKIKNTNKIYDNYNITKNEHIIAYIKSSVILFPLSVDGNIITDKAVYHHPSHDDWSYTNRVPFSDLCRYIPLMLNDKSELIIINSEEEHTLIGNTLFGKNKGGIELLSFLRDIQNYLVSHFDWACTQHNTEINKLISKSKQMMREGLITENINGALQIIKEDKKFSLDVTLIEGEYIFRQSDIDNFTSFINSINDVNIQKKIMESTKMFEESFITDLANYNLMMDYKFLNNARNNILKRTALSNELYTVLSYISIRLRDDSGYNTYIEHIQHHDKLGLRRKFEIFKGSYYNMQMETVFKKIQYGINPIPESLDWTDSIGLDPLHYAIILHQETVIENILYSGKFTSKHSIEKSNTVYNLYDYNVLAAYFNIGCKREICINTAPEILSQYDMYESMIQEADSLDKEFHSLRQEQYMLSRKHRESYHTPEEDNAFSSQIYNMQQNLNSLMQRCGDIKRDAALLKHKINNDIDNILKSAASNVSTLNSLDEPFAKFLLNIYNTPDFLYHIISDESDEKLLYMYGDLFFVTPYDVHINLYYYDNPFGEKKLYSNKDYNYENNSFNYGKALKLYGNSWFSPEAHKNIKILRSEYVELAKKFHPDQSKTSETAILFQEITLERNNIKSNLI